MERKETGRIPNSPASKSPLGRAVFTFMDDTPAYYFAKAALAFVQKKDDEAKEWLEKANVIFKSADNATYLDSLMETRHIPNIMFAPSEPK